MKFTEPFLFWAIQPDGHRACQAYEHVHSYCEGASIQYARTPRNTFEHYEDQVLGRDSRGNSPGWGLALSGAGGFSLGTQQKVPLDQASYEQLRLFIDEFDATIESIVAPAAPPAAATQPQ